MNKREKDAFLWISTCGKSPDTHLYAKAVEQLMRRSLILRLKEDRYALTPKGLKAYTRMREQQFVADGEALQRKYQQDLERADQNTQR